MHVSMKNGDLINTFLVPSWGAVSLYNECKPVSRTIKIDQKQVMSHFIAQFKLLLGLHPVMQLHEDFDVKSGLNEFELFHLSLLRTVEYIATSMHTLASLSDLLGKITNIVINDQVADAIYTSVYSLEQAKQELANGNLQAALKSAKKSFEASETAFYDPTLLGLLYFPEDQKFAIYIPLFLPISIPLFLSFVNAVKQIKSKKEKTE